MLRKNIRTAEVGFVESISSNFLYFFFFLIQRNLDVSFTLTLYIQSRVKRLNICLAASAYVAT